MKGLKIYEIVVFMLREHISAFVQLHKKSFRYSVMKMCLQKHLNLSFFFDWLSNDYRIIQIVKNLPYNCIFHLLFIY